MCDKRRSQNMRNIEYYLEKLLEIENSFSSQAANFDH